MYELPLFPLNTILYPSMPLHLHIFEDRYKSMIDRCIAEDTPFGVVLIKSGNETGGTAEPHTIGCTAKIEQIQPLENGRMNMSAIGHTRFKIHQLKHDEPYLVGLVEYLPFNIELSKKDYAKGKHLKTLLKNYIDVLSSIGDINIHTEYLPTEPIQLAYMAAMLLQAPREKKQDFLKIEQGDELIQAVYDSCRHEISVLRNMLDPAASPRQDGPFSLN